MPWIHLQQGNYALSLVDGYLSREPTPLLKRTGAYARGESMEDALAEAVCYREIGVWAGGRQVGEWPASVDVWVIGTNDWAKDAPAPMKTLIADEENSRYRIVIRGRPFDPDQYIAADTARCSGRRAAPSEHEGTAP